MLDAEERAYLEAARVARLATAAADGRPHVVPVCFAVTDDAIVTPIDEKPKRVSAGDLSRVRDIEENDAVALLADHYTEDWSRLGWLQVRGTAAYTSPERADHGPAAAALRRKYAQYASHDLDSRPLIRITPTAVRSWGALERSPT